MADNAGRKGRAAEWVVWPESEWVRIKFSLRVQFLSRADKAGIRMQDANRRPACTSPTESQHHAQAGVRACEWMLIQPDRLPVHCTVA